MATHIEAADFARDAAIRAPLTAAITAAAIQISTEDPDTPLHEVRVELAHRVLVHPASMVDQFAWALSTNATVVDKWAAGNLEGAVGDFAYVIATVWDALAEAN